MPNSSVIKRFPRNSRLALNTVAVSRLTKSEGYLNVSARFAVAGLMTVLRATPSEIFSPEKAQHVSRLGVTLSSGSGGTCGAMNLTISVRICLLRVFRVFLGNGVKGCSDDDCESVGDGISDRISAGVKYDECHENAEDNNQHQLYEIWTNGHFFSPLYP